MPLGPITAYRYIASRDYAGIGMLGRGAMSAIRCIPPTIGCLGSIVWPESIGNAG